MSAPRFRECVDLNVPADHAFRLLADPSSATMIDPAVTEYRPNTAALEAGTEITIRFRMWGAPLRVVSTVRAWSPSERMVMENIRPSRPIRATATHDFVVEGEERCTYCWAMEFEPTVSLARPLAGLFARFMRSNARAQQERFRIEAERRWRDASSP